MNKKIWRGSIKYQNRGDFEIRTFIKRNIPINRTFFFNFGFLLLFFQDKHFREIKSRFELYE